MSHTPSTIGSFSSEMFDSRFLTTDNFHCDFHMEGGDTILVSSDGVNFRTHSFILKVASPVFRKLLSAPIEDEHVGADRVLKLLEDSRTVCAVLRMISGMELPPLDDFEELERILVSAKKWEMSGPPSIIYHMSIPHSLTDDPIRLYALACKVGWREAAILAATHTLDVDLGHEEIVPHLHNMASADVLKLIDLRTRRRDGLLDFLLSYPAEGCLSHLPHPKSSESDAAAAEFSIQCQWKSFIFTVFIAMDRHPSGKTLLGPNSVLQSELEDMRNTRCPQCEDVPAFDVDELVKALTKKIAELPKTISM